MTIIEAAVELDLSTERVRQLCKKGRLGYTHPKHGRAWVITMEEIERYRKAGPLLAGRPRERDCNG